MYRNLELVPAYGRDYKSKAAVLADWKNGKDFLLIDMALSGYVNVNEVPLLKKDGITHLHFRYKKQTTVAVLPL